MTASNRKPIVIYRSKYGSAKCYAEWIAEELSADLFDGTIVTINDLLKYDTIIFGGSLYAVGILGISLIKDHFEKIADKKVIIFSVGASPAVREALETVRNANFTPKMKLKVHYFHLRGGFDYSKLGFIHKIMMCMLKLKIKHKKPEDRSNDEKEMLSAYEKPVDFKNKKAISPIIRCANDENR